MSGKVKPNFLLIGAGKCATTSIADLLGRHPEVYFCEPKEPRFFSDDAKYPDGMDEYLALFNPGAGRRAIGEGSVSYAVEAINPNTADRIAEHLPHAKLIYMVRHPLDRIESAWLQLNYAGESNLPFDRALRDRRQIVDASRYWKQLSRYRAHFPDEQIHVELFEEFRRDAVGVMRRLFQFLDVDPDAAELDADRPRNATRDHRLDGGLLTVARRLQGFGRIRDALPTGLRNRLRARLKSRPAAKPAWTPELRRWAIEQVAGDARAILRYCDRPEDLWDLNPDADPADDRSSRPRANAAD